jgi:hypothetical protein
VKKTLSFGLMLVLILSATGGALAAVHNFNSDFGSPNLLPDFAKEEMPDFEGWYYITQDRPAATVRGAFGDGYAFGAELFQTDQSFIDFYYYDPDDSGSYLYLKGSYLYETGFFVGVDYGDSQLTVAPGYRFDLDDHYYIAASLDYALNHQYSTSDSENGYQSSGLIDLEVNGRYYDTDRRFYGQLIIPNGSVAGSDDLFLLGGGAYQYNNNIVIGANLISRGNYNYFDIGFSAVFDQLGAELRYINADDCVIIDANVLYSFAPDIRAGLEVRDRDDEDDPDIILKGKFRVDRQTTVILMQQLQNDTVTYLCWDISF